MVKGSNKPRLVFFQWKHNALPEFLQLHMQLHVKCLSEFFDVILINEDCDYQQVCDTYQPELALFESGFRSLISQKITIKNTSAYPEIPKLGLHNGDPWCDCRVGFISDMEHWGIETFFSIGTTTAESTPEIADYLFAWPNFIDSDIYRDYNQPKIVPVLFNGGINPLYPWRQKIYKLVSSSYPSLIYPHLGYESKSPMMIHGKQYARTINASWFVPSCGTIAKEVVRKHFEIPGSKACLITEKSPSLEAAGFVDMQNCVFADENNVLDKLDYLFRNQHELEKIINAGYELVHTQHTLKQRDQIFQWFNLNKDLKSNEKIIQSNPFEPLRVVEKSSGIKNSPIICEGLHLMLLRQGDEKLWSGKYDEAEACYLKCLNFISWMPEPKLKLAICNLFMGKAAEALAWINEVNLANFTNYRAIDPDPVEWAYLIISLLCQGKLNEAIIRSNLFPSLHHPELDRIRWIINCLQNGGNNNIPLSSSPKPRYSVHQLPQLSFIDWVNNLCNMLEACNQFSYTERLSKVVSQKDGLLEEQEKRSGGGLMLLRKNMGLIRNKWLEKLALVFDVLQIPNPKPVVPPYSEMDFIIRLSRWARIDSVKRFILKYPSRLKGFLRKTNHEFLQAVQTLLQNESIKSAIIISASSSATVVESIFTKMLTRQDMSRVFQINILDTQINKVKNNYDAYYGSKYYELMVDSGESFSSEINACIRKIKQENEISYFDLVLIDSSKFNGCVELDELQGAKFIVLNNINTPSYYKNKQKLVSDLWYTLVSQNPMHQNGYAIFKKLKDCHSVAFNSHFNI